MISNTKFFKKTSIILMVLLGYDLFFPFSVMPVVGEMAVTVAGFVCLAFVLIAALYSYYGAMEREEFYPRYIVLIVLGGLLFLTTFARAATWEKLTWDCDGVVSKKYIESNHAQESIKVRGQKNATMVHVDHVFWKHVKVGDTIRKKEWSEYCYLNGQEVRIVPKGLLVSLCGWRLPKAITN